MMRRAMDEDAQAWLDRLCWPACYGDAVADGEWATAFVTRTLWTAA